MPHSERPDRERSLHDRLLARLDQAKHRSGIPRRVTDGPAPLSPMQESIWLLQKMEPGSVVYHRPVALRLSGSLNTDALRAALGDLVERHEALRSAFVLRDGRPYQETRPFTPPSLDVLDVASVDDPLAEALALAKRAAGAPIDLERGPLGPVRLFRTGESDHLLVLPLHHLAFDGWSEGALRADLAAAYEARQRGGAPAFEPLAVQMADVASWQRQRQTSASHDTDLTYWRRQLDGLPTPFDLPTDRPRAGASPASAVYTFKLPAALTERLLALARQENATLYAVLLSALQVLLARYARQNDFAVGTPVAGRTHAEMEGVVGCLINVLVLRARVNPDASFRAHLGRVRRTVIDALAHQEAPLADVVAAAFPDRRSFDPVYQVLFQLRNLPEVERTGGIGIHPVWISSGGLATDLALDVVALGDEGGLSCRLAYRTDLFDAETIERMAGHLRVLLGAAATDPDQTVGRLPLLTPGERRHVLVNVQAPRLPPLDLGGIHVLVEQQAARTPDAVAVVWGEDTWTYGEINARANRLARRLRARGVGPGVIVALGFGRSPELVMAMIAVLKAGGAYLPIDEDAPEARVRAMLDGAGAPVLLVRGTPPWRGLSVGLLDLEALDLSDGPGDNLPADNPSPDRPAYVLYTSGSTGAPKGVVITQANLLAAAPSWEQVYGLGHLNAFIATSRPTFDVFSEGWIRALGFGLRLVICPHDTLLDPPQLARLIRENEIDALSGVPAVFRLLTTHLEETGQRLDGVQFVVVGADVWRPDDHVRLQAVVPNALIQNTYGITETTVSNSFFEGDPPALPSGTVPIGRPYPNSLLYVLDDVGEPLPVGVPGELHIGGPVVGAGYVGQPDLTAERFVPDPFSDVPGARMYKSGDLARWLPSGDLDFLGRTDFQVKIRGLRIELGEIESVLMEHASVAEAVVTVLRGTRDDALVAHVVPSAGASVDVDTLRHHVRGRLPAYMVPSAFAVLDRFPLSANGKVDRRALEATDVGYDRQARGGPPQTPEEIDLAGIWAEVLGHDLIGPGDDFFDLGGHSLQAMQVLARVQQRWGVSLAFRDLVETPSLAALANRIRLRAADSELDDLLEDLGGLSDDEIQRLLGGPSAGSPDAR